MSRLLSFLMVSLEANASSTNWKLGMSSGVFFSRLMLKPNNCTLLIDTLPLNKGSISNFAERRDTFSISLSDWSFNNKSSIIMRFSSPILIRPMVSCVPSTLVSSFATSTDICR